MATGISLCPCLPRAGPKRARIGCWPLRFHAQIPKNGTAIGPNPGDAGQGMRLTLDLPAGVEDGASPLYPVPPAADHQRADEPHLRRHLCGAGASRGACRGGGLRIWCPITGPRRISRLLPTRSASPQDATADIAVPGGDFARWRRKSRRCWMRGRALLSQDRLCGSRSPCLPALGCPIPHVFHRHRADWSTTPRRRPCAARANILVADIPLDARGEGDVVAVPGILAFGDGAGVRFEAVSGPVPEGGELIAGPKGALTPPLWTLILGALAGGLLLNIMPCVFPILSLKALSLARAGESGARAQAEGLAYTAGVVLACVGLGALLLALRAAGEQVGWAFQLQEPGVVVALLVLAAMITANFAGLFELPSLRR